MGFSPSFWDPDGIWFLFSVTLGWGEKDVDTLGYMEKKRDKVRRPRWEMGLVG